MARIYDNIEVKFHEGLEGIITSSGVERVDFCVGYFNIRGWNMIVNQVDSLPGGYVYENDMQQFRTCRLLVGMHRQPEELIRAMYTADNDTIDSDYILRCKLQIAAEFRKQLLIGLPTKQDEWTLRRLAAQLKEKKVCVKLYLKEPLHAKLYLAYRPNDFSSKIVGIMGSSNLTYSGFMGQGELNADFTDSDHVEKLARWFDDRWNERQCLDITDELIKAIDESWASDQIIPPYYIYLKTAYHLSQEARSGIKEFALSPIFQHELFDFQQTAVKIAARHLRNEKRGGAMIGDVVGLGKTITACAIAKIYETTYASSTLIICPANLQDMWQKYAKKYDLKVDIMSMAKPIDVDNARYYRLIIIDESHNLRNGGSGKRYANIKQLVDHQDCNVLLLSATPYNKDFSDLANQLKLFLSEDQDLGIRPEEYIRSLGGERAFMQKHSEVFIRSVKAFEQSPCVEDWNELMKLFLVRRTRTFIKENYAKTDEADGRRYLQFNDGSKSYFPERIPKALKFKTEKGDQYTRLYSDDMVAMMAELLLPRYGLVNYISEGKTADASASEKLLIENLSRAGNRMMGFCKSTFFKRMDSSGFSFLLTLYRHILRNMVFVYAVDNKLPLPIGDENALPDEYIDDEDVNATLFGGDNDSVITEGEEITFPTDIEVYREKAAAYYELISQKNNLAWLDNIYFKRTLKQHLVADCNTLIDMIRLCGAWQPNEDKKLEQLEELLTDKHTKDKVIIFTQYSDTALYVYRQLRKRGIDAVACVTGGSMNPTALVERFSPVSNGAYVAAENELRVLVATDVLSEGQNLQDSHVIINYDLPWAIIRLIQRAGRVDRIGQQEDKIFCYSFFPAEGVENIINLRKRLGDRINANANIIGSDEVFFEGNEKNLRDMFNEKSGALDEEDDADVDLSSQAYQIWKNATDANPKLKTIIPNIPNIAYSTKATDNALEQGVITYARTANDFDVLTWLSPQGEIVSQSQKRILGALACSADTPAVEPLDNHHELVGHAVATIAEQSATTSIGGILGNRFSTRYRIIQLLEHCYEQPLDNFFTEEMKNNLKLAINDIYNYPLVDTTKVILGQMLRRSGTAKEDIVEQVLELRRTGNLCRIAEDTNTHRDPQIICSMGLSKTEQA